MDSQKWTRGFMASVSEFIPVVSAQIISRSRSGRHVKIAVWRVASRGLSAVVPLSWASAIVFGEQGVFSLLVHLSAFLEIWNITGYWKLLQTFELLSNSQVSWVFSTMTDKGFILYCAAIKDFSVTTLPHLFWWSYSVTKQNERLPSL